MDKREKNRIDEVRQSIDLDPKAESLRRALERDREISPENKMLATDLLFFPPEKVPEGWEYRWIRKSALGSPDTNHERTQMRNGWTPVPASRHPEEARNHLCSAEEIDSNVMVRSGLILCEMPKITIAKYERQRNSSIQAMMDSLNGAVQDLKSDPTIPAGIIANRDDFTNSTGRTFGYN